jgi:t-SNARE complex subunit (syntaxin)
MEEENMQKYDGPGNDLKVMRRELLRKIFVWLIVILIVLMLIFIVIFNPKFYTFADLILPKYSFN